MNFKRYENDRFVIYDYSNITGQYAPFASYNDPKDAFNAARIRAKQLNTYRPVDENGEKFSPTDVRVFEIPMDKTVAIYNEKGLILIDYNLGRPKKHKGIYDLSAPVHKTDVTTRRI